MPKIVSAGIALSPYQRSADYASTGARNRALWIELEAPPADPRDRFFARVLCNAPDPLLSSRGETVTETADLPLPIDPEWARVIVHSNDHLWRAGHHSRSAIMKSSFVVALSLAIALANPNRTLKNSVRAKQYIESSKVTLP